jgi:hypothetical protein
MLEFEQIHPLSVDLYRVRYSGLNSAFYGAVFVNGVTVDPVIARNARRLKAAFGKDVIVELWTPQEKPKPRETVAVAPVTDDASELKLAKKRTRRATPKPEDNT